MSVFRDMLERFKSSEKAQGMVEYGLILALVSVVAVGAVGGVGDKVKSTFDNVVNGSGIEAPVVVKHTVTFVDYDGGVLKSMDVVEGESAIAPEDPTRDGHKFSGWDKSFDNVTGDLEVVAQYDVNTYTVTFKDDKGKVIETIEVAEGESAIPSKEPTKEGHTFTGWSLPVDSVRGDVEVTPEFKINTYTVKFLNADGSELATQTIEHGSNAKLPKVPRVPSSINTADKWEGAVVNINSDGEVKFKYALVSTPDDLQAIGNSKSTLGKSYLQVSDINLSGIDNFEPIGADGNVFTGEFDGGGFVISNLTVDRGEDNYAGLFGRMDGATLKNIGLENIDVKGGSYVGGLVGLNNTKSSVTNSYTTGVVSGRSYVGGFVGANWNWSTISDSYATGKVSGSSGLIGGLVGYHASQSKLTNSYATGKVYGAGNYTGGLVGRNASATISNSGWANDVNTTGIGGNEGTSNNVKGQSKSDIYEIIKNLIK